MCFVFCSGLSRTSTSTENWLVMNSFLQCTWLTSSKEVNPSLQSSPLTSYLPPIVRLQDKRWRHIPLEGCQEVLLLGWERSWLQVRQKTWVYANFARLCLWYGDIRLMVPGLPSFVCVLCVSNLNLVFFLFLPWNENIVYLFDFKVQHQAAPPFSCHLSSLQWWRHNHNNSSSRWMNLQLGMTSLRESFRKVSELKLSCFVLSNCFACRVY